MLSLESNKDISSHTHMHMHTSTYIFSCTLAFVTRFTAEELPHSLKKHIEEGFQEWEENLYKVTGTAYLLASSIFFATIWHKE